MIIQNRNKNNKINKDVKFNSEIMNELKQIKRDQKYYNLNSFLENNVFTKEKICETIDDLNKINNKKNIKLKILNDLQRMKSIYVNNILQLINYKKKLSDFLKKTDIVKSYTEKPKLIFDTKDIKEIENKLKIFQINKTKINNSSKQNINLEILKVVLSIFNIKLEDLDKLIHIKNKISKKIIKINTNNNLLEIDNYKLKYEKENKSKKKILYYNGEISIKIYEKFYFILPFLADILDSIINNNEYILFDKITDEDELLKTIHNNLPIFINNYSSFNNKKQNNKINHNKKGGNNINLENKFKIFEKIIVGSKDLKPINFYEKYLKNQFDVKSYQPFNLIPTSLQKKINEIINLFNEIKNELEDNKNKSNNFNINNTEISKLLIRLKNKRKNKKYKKYKRDEEHKLNELFKHNIKNYKLNFDNNFSGGSLEYLINLLSGGYSKNKKKQNKKKQNKKKKNNKNHKIKKIEKYDDYYINFINFFYGQTNIDKYTILKYKKTNLHLFCFFPLFIKNDKIIKDYFKKNIINNYSNLIENIINLNLNFLFNKYEFIVYFLNLINDIKNKNNNKNYKNNNKNNNNNKKKIILSNKNKNNIKTFFKNKNIELKNINSKLSNLKKKSKNDINFQIMINKKINSLELKKKKIKNNISKIKKKLS